MEIKALLPKPKEGDWPHKEKIGVHEISEQDYHKNLCENYYKASDYGTPSPLANAIVFVQRLEHYNNDKKSNKESAFEKSFKLWAMLLKGIYFGLIKCRPINLMELSDIGKIVAAELPNGFKMELLSYRMRDAEKETVVGYTYEKVGFVPSVRLSELTIKEIDEEISKRDSETAPEYFGSWVHRFDEKDQGNLLFYSLLYHLVAQWCHEDKKKDLPMEIEKLFEKGPQLWLVDKKEIAEDIARPQLWVYKGTPIICSKCGAQIGMTDEDIEIKEPDDCRCPQCMTQQNWLEKYGEWLKYNKTRGCYLIYDFQNSPTRQQPLKNCLKVKDDYVLIQSGRIKIKIIGLVLSEDALKCKRLIFFKDGEREKRPDLPVRGEYFGLVSLSRAVRNPYLDPVNKTYTVVVDVVDWKHPITIKYDEKQYEYEEALLLSWPNFKLKGWNVYYFLLATTPPMYKAGIGMRVLAENGHHQLLDSTRGKMEMDFGAIEIVFTEKEKKITLQSGIFLVHRNEIQSGETKLTMAIDFGTSSSSITYQLGEGPIEILRYTDFTEEVIPNTMLSDEVLNSSSWLPTYHIDNPQTALKYYRNQLDSDDSIFLDGDKIIKNLNYFIPSEVICAHPVSRENLARPLSGFRICHVYAARPQDEVIYEIKLLDEKGDSKGRYSYDQIVSRYLEMFLILSLATIVNKEQIAGYLHIKASFPRNFETSKVKLYLDCLKSQLDTVGRLTGFNTNKILYMDESRAAAYSVTNESGGLRVVMDMGGGTTDIGVFERVKGKLEPVFIESLLYGANSYVRMLADNAELFPKPSVKLDNRLLWLFREIRLRSFETVVRTNYRGNKHSQDVALDFLLRFFNPIAYFISRLFDALNIQRGNKTEQPQGNAKDYKKESITLYLVGNGWGLADAHEPIDEGFKKGHKEVLRYLLQKEGFTNLTITSEPVADESLAVWPGPKAAIGFGLMKAPENIFYQSIEEAYMDDRGIQSIFGFDIKFNDGSNTFEEHKWHEPIPCKLGTNIQRPVLENLQIPAEWNFIEYEKGKQVGCMEEVCGKDVVRVEKPIISRSILARFLENIYIKQLNRDRRI